ncbi:MAG TPA: hypothetical protein VGE59_02895 [Patescibacteria group bacterium]
MDTHPHPSTPFPTDQAAREVLKRLNMEEISDEAKERLLTQIADLIDQEILYQVMSRLSNEDITELGEFLQTDENSHEESLKPEAFNFIASKIPHLDVIIRDSIVKVYEDIVSTKNLLDA